MHIPTEHLIKVRRHKEWPFSRPDIRYGFPPSVVHIIRRPIAKRFVIRNLVHPRSMSRQVQGLAERLRTRPQRESLPAGMQGGRKHISFASGLTLGVILVSRIKICI